MRARDVSDPISRTLARSWRSEIRLWSYSILNYSRHNLHRGAPPTARHLCALHASEIWSPKTQIRRGPEFNCLVLVSSALVPDPEKPRNPVFASRSRTAPSGIKHSLSLLRPCCDQRPCDPSEAGAGTADDAPRQRDTNHAVVDTFQRRSGTAWILTSWLGIRRVRHTSYHYGAMAERWVPGAAAASVRLGCLGRLMIWNAIA